MAPRPSALGIVVADMAASLAFYRRLGLVLPPDADGQPHVEADLGGFRLLWDTHDTIRSFDPSWTPPAGGGHAMALAFECDGPAEVDALHNALVAEGHRSHLAPWDAFWGQRYATVVDPDGNTVDLFAALPAASPSG
jgi:catechol 2,3-dioxygenase-like lactoylglutathione lyase family enzyme